MGLKKAVIKMLRRPEPIKPIIKPENVGKIKGEVIIDGKTKKSNKSVLPENIDLKKTKIFHGSFEIGTYNMKYSKVGKSFYITWFSNPSQKTNFNDMRFAIFKIKDIAKKSGCKYIFCNTWIFIKNPIIKEQLGFKAVKPLEEKKYIALLKENDIKTLEARRIPYPEYYLKI